MRAVSFAGLVLILGVTACATPRGADVLERRSYVHHMERDTLEQLYRSQPRLRSRVESAVAYAVFSNLGVHLLVVGGSHGYGIVHDNRTGRDTFMRMAQLETGIGVGVKDFRAVFIFHDDPTYRTFVDKGWQFGAEAEASAIAEGDIGLTVNAQGSFAGGGPAGGISGVAGIGSNPPAAAASRGQGLEIYQFTKNGIVLRAGLAGTKYWKDRKLNAGEKRLPRVSSNRR